MLAAARAAVQARLEELDPRTRRAWGWDLATETFAGLYNGAIWTFVQRIARADLHATTAQMAWISSAPAVGYLFATLWARQMEGRSKLPFVYWTWLVARGVFVLTPFLATREQYVALVCFTPILFSVSTPAYTATMREIHPDRQRGRLMSGTRIVRSLFTLLTALVAGRLLDHGVDYGTVFAFGGVCGALSAFAFSRIPVPPMPAEQECRSRAGEFLRDTFGILVRNPGFRWFSASVFVSGFGNLVATTLYPIYQVDVFHVSNTTVAELQNTASIATILSFFFWGGFLDRRGPLTTVLVALAANLVTPLAYATSHTLWPLYVAAAASGFAMAGVDLGYLNTTLLFAEPGKAAQYQALHSSFFGIRGTIAPQFAVPLMHAFGARNTFWIAFSIMVFGVWLQLVSMRDFRRQARRAMRGRREAGE